MAEASSSEAQDHFTCPVCLDLLKDPVTIPCGHSYCRDCIEDYWVQADNAGVYRCPQCRQTFTPRPVLGRNTMLAEVLEKVKKAEVQAAPPDRYTTGQLQDKICSLREKWLEVYCRTDQQCICYQCLMDEHKGHDSLSCPEIPQGYRKTEQCQDSLRTRPESKCLSVCLQQHSARAALEDTESIFSEMIHSIERRRSEVRDLIRAQEKSEGSRAEGLLERLEQEIDELKRRDDELEQLSHTEDHIYFLQVRPLDFLPNNILHNVFGLKFLFHLIFKVAYELKEQLGNAASEKIEMVSQTVHKEYVLHISEPRTRAEYLQCACQLTLDPNTVSVYFSLSEGGALMRHPQSHPDHAERFDGWEQVLCEEGLTGRCYWEVKWRGKWVHIGVSYKGTSRKGHGKDSCLGHNNKSWSLFCSPYDYHFTHNDKKTPVSGPCSSTIGVYLDHSTGTLSFYSISEDTMTLHHRVQTTFTEPLYPAFGFQEAEISQVSTHEQQCVSFI
uniref:Tripartite motif-containing protein 16-like n=1 Tax=Scleropages formosus TaxID=113540 RepID=A0A8C9RCW7_SCLFO